MKKVLLVSSLAVVATAAQAIDMPKISGRLNNEVRYASQSDKSDELANGYSAFTGLSGSANAPSYLAASGNIPVNEMMNIDYIAEIGIRVDTNAVDLRQNSITVNSDFGHLVLGHTYTPSSAIGSFDPFGATGAGLGGSDLSGIVAGYNLYEKEDVAAPTWDTRATVDGIGYRHTLRKDIIGYKSPKFMGMQLFVSQDRDNNESAATKKAQRYDAALNYDQKFGDVGVKAMANYLVKHGAGALEETQMTGAVKVSFMDFDLSGAYTATEMKLGGNDVEKTQMFAAASYKLDAHKLSLAYAMKEFEIKETDKTKTEQSQLSLGYEYAFNTNVAGTFTGSMVTIEDKSATDPEKKNDATVLTTGLRVTF